MRQTIASTLSVLTLLGAPTVSHALSCAPRHFTLSEAYEAADSVIVGQVTNCRLPISKDPWANGGDDCSFTSLEVLKASVPARDYSGVASSSGCGLSLHVGRQYLLFLDSQNQPMQFSMPLSGDRVQPQLANRYLQIIRDYGDGVVPDLAEPWILDESGGGCSIRHTVKGNQISFSYPTADAPKRAIPDWTQDTIDGQTVYRSRVPTYKADMKSPSGFAEIVTYGNVPENADDSIKLSVSLAERSPGALRQATLSVGSKTWSLNRLEIILLLRGASTHKIVQYYGAGDVAEQILAAMIQPSDTVVSATVVESTKASETPTVAPPDQNMIGPSPSTGIFRGRASPETSSSKPPETLAGGAADTYLGRREPPEPVLRVESRSTQLSSVLPSFRACYGGDDQ